MASGQLGGDGDQWRGGTSASGCFASGDKDLEGRRKVEPIEVFVSQDGRPVLCEIAGRPGGGGIIPAFQHRYGIDLNLMTALPQHGLPIPAMAEGQPQNRRHPGTAVTGVARAGPR